MSLLSNKQPSQEGCLLTKFAWLTVFLSAFASLACMEFNLDAQVTASPSALQFGAASVGQATASAQQLMVTFALGSSYSGTTPTATLHYGLHYSMSNFQCSNTTCTVAITFRPTLPGDRRDAIFLMNGSTRLATVLIDGLGESPLALLQPGVASHVSDSINAYFYQSVTDENGTVYVARYQSVYGVTSISHSGVVTQLPISFANPPDGTIAIDGAGVLYIGTMSYTAGFVTYDTVQGTQSSIVIAPSPAASGGIFALGAVGGTGTLYAVDTEGSSTLYTVPPGGPSAALNLNLTNGSQTPYSMALDTSGDIFLGGTYYLDEVPAGGTITSINTTGGAGQGLAVDAAATLYATQFPGVSPGVTELGPSNYASSEGTIDQGSSPDGVSVDPSGTVAVSNNDMMDFFNRSQGLLDFGQLQEATATVQTAQLYNGGNQPLTVSDITLANTSPSGQAVFSLGTAPADRCSLGTVLQPGAMCNLAVSANTPNGGYFTGTVTIASNSLNDVSSTSVLALTASTLGSFVVGNPRSLSFGYQAPGSTSPAQTIKLTNIGDTYAATLFSPSSTDPAFNVSLGTCISSLPVGSSCQLSVSYSPTASQADIGTGSVQIENFGANQPPAVSFALTGTGLAPAIAQLTPSMLAFPATFQGTTSAALTATLSNTGSAPVTITGMAIAGSGASSFKISATTCGASLAVSASCTISITFTPGSTELLAANLSVTDDAISSPQTASLTGTGTIYRLAIVEDLHVIDIDLAQTSTLLNLTETIQVSDIDVATPSTALNIAEIINLTDLPTLIAPVMLNIAEVIHTTDLPVLSPSVSIHIAESIQTTDTDLLAVLLIPTETTLTSSVNPSVAGQTVTFTASVSSGTGDPPGTVQFLIGGSAAGMPVPLNAAGMATYSTFALGDGVKSISAMYSGSGSFVRSASGVLSQSVVDFDFSAVPPHSATVSPGGSATFQFAIAPRGAFGNTITFSASGLPPGATATFDPLSVTPGDRSSTVTMSVQTAVQTASSSIAPDSFRRRENPLLLSILLPLLGLRRTRGMLKRRGLFLMAMFSLVVVFALSGCGGDGFITQPAQTYTIIVTATSGALQHSTTVNLNVQ